MSSSSEGSICFEIIVYSDLQPSSTLYGFFLSLKIKYFGYQFQVWLSIGQNCVAFRYAILKKLNTASFIAKYGLAAQRTWVAGLGWRFNNEWCCGPAAQRQTKYISKWSVHAPCLWRLISSRLISRLVRSLDPCHVTLMDLLIICSLLNLNLLCYGFLNCFSCLLLLLLLFNN